MEFMKVALIFSLILNVCKAIAFIGLGLLLFYHFESLVTLVTRRSVPEDLPLKGWENPALSIIRFIGVLFILIGFVTLIMGFVSIIPGFNMGQNINLKF
jgi:hypothetical protein